MAIFPAPAPLATDSDKWLGWSSRSRMAEAMMASPRISPPWPEPLLKVRMMLSRSGSGRTRGEEGGAALAAGGVAHGYVNGHSSAFLACSTGLAFRQTWSERSTQRPESR